MKIPPVLIVAGVAVAIIAIGFFLYPRKRREGFQTETSSPILVTQPPPNLIGNQEACRMFRNLIDGVSSQLQRADELNYPGQVELLNATKKSLEEQLALLKCA